MKQLFLVTLLALQPIVNADEFIQMSNGMTCWRNSNGHTYGCSGGTSTGDSGFNDVRTGERYEMTGRSQAVSTKSGLFVNTPVAPYEKKLDPDYYQRKNMIDSMARETEKKRRLVISRQEANYYRLQNEELLQQQSMKAHLKPLSACLLGCD